MCYTFLRSTLGAIEFSTSCRPYEVFQVHARQLFVVPSRVLESLACESNIPPLGGALIARCSTVNLTHTFGSFFAVDTRNLNFWFRIYILQFAT